LTQKKYFEQKLYIN